MKHLESLIRSTQVPRTLISHMLSRSVILLILRHTAYIKHPTIPLIKLKSPVLPYASLERLHNTTKNKSQDFAALLCTSHYHRDYRLLLGVLHRDHRGGGKRRAEVIRKICCLNSRSNVNNRLMRP